jgi:rhodanese-related sulfurtransferase
MRHSPGFLKLVTDAKQNIQEYTTADVRSLRENGHTFHFLDIREDREYLQGRAAGATHLGRGILERDIENLIPDKEAEIVLYCGGGYRSALAADSLQRMGYSDVHSMVGAYAPGMRPGCRWKPGNRPGRP